MNAATDQDGLNIVEAEDEDDIALRNDPLACIRSELLVGRAMEIMDMIFASIDNPNPCLLHALAAILEKEEARFVFSFLCFAVSFVCDYIYLNPLFD